MTLPLADCSDGELASLAIAGRQTAFGELMRRYREPVYRLVRGHIGDADEALDLTQDSFIAAFTALKSYDSTRPFRSWISRIAINKCRDWGRRRTVRRLFTFAVPIEAAANVADNGIPADIAIGDAHELARVSAAIGKLPVEIREPLILHTIEGLSQSETAHILGISEKAVETRLYRARQRLSVLLDQAAAS